MQIKKIIKSKKRKKRDGSKTKSKKRVVRRRRTPTIYCGNNRLHPDLQNGNAIQGTRYRCLQKGFGVGYHVIPLDVNMLLPYEPIYDEKIYCGNSDDLPQDYDRFGNLPSCFQKGVGVGKKKRAQQN
jgi:hypothetical protein